MVSISLAWQDYKAILHSQLSKLQQDRQSFLRSIPLLEALPNIPNLAALLQSRAFCRHGILINVGTSVMHIYLVSSGTFSVRGRIKVKPPKDQPLQLPWQLILSKIGGWSGFLCVANLQSENLKH